MAKQVSRTRKVLGSIFRIKAWLDAERIKMVTNSLYQGAVKLFTPPKRPASSQTVPDNAQTALFKETMKKYKIDLQDLEKTEQALLRWAYSMFLFACLLILLFIYYLLDGSWHAAVLTLVGIGISLILAFRYHFFSFQIRQRKLGCTVKAWWRMGILGRAE